MAANLPPRIPVIPVRDVIVFPGIITPLFIKRPRTLKAIESAMLQERTVLVVGQQAVDAEDPAPDQIYEVGTVCGIIQMVRIPGGASKVLVEGIVRAKVTSYETEDDFLMANIAPRTWDDTSANLLPLQRSVLEQFEKYNQLQQKIPSEVMGSILGIENPLQLVEVVGAHMNVKLEIKQKLLEIFDSEEALKYILKVLFEEIDILEVEKNIQDKVRNQVEQHNREYYLREQMKAIQSELGSGMDENIGEIAELTKKIDSADMSEEAKNKALHELDRMKRMPAMSPEAVVIRTYLDWLISLPWQVRSEDMLDIARAEKILDEDHYGLEKVKERILEFLAVRRLVSEGPSPESMRAQVLCFIGPPGVGKTSLGRSIARALGKNFVNFSLGGMRDEAEIRGHRRTYIGSLPGRIIQQLRKAGTRNPVMLLDEIDKLGSDFRGDPASALLEVLDPQQNHNFSDHFLDVPFDLHEVLFITTANSYHAIPKPLLDRMEVIRLSGYVQQEKVHIARGHLLPRVLKENGITKGKLKLSAQALNHVITEYTREAGVRELERQLSNIARKVARKIVDSGQGGKSADAVYNVKVGNLNDYLGAPKLFDTRVSSEPSRGLATGLAWTESGGDVLMIEVAVMKGKGNIVLTGNLGDVMKESAAIAISHLRSKSKELKIPRVDWEKTDIHLHVPDGAVPKDGPSAGVTMASAVLSALGGRLIRNDVAMTGEISLQGRVLPVGGIKEKVLAAKRYNISEVILPKPNQVDISEIPENIIAGMTFHYVSNVEDVFERAFL
ncbi:MAG: endopeptidase La [Synergistaceae bacterium]|nr:endopeptidase La [Synergistaceae bacterium]